MFQNYAEGEVVAIQGEYATSIVILSILIAVIASYTALTMNGRAQRNGFFNRYIWLLFASVAMGFGIWSMHFVGMSAISLPVHMKYNVSLTVLSIAPAMLASFLAFYLSSLPKRGFWIYILAGISMGTGISIMHYMGMYAMEMDILYTYNRFRFVLSIIIAVAVSMIAVYIFSSLQLYMKNRWIQLFTALIMGLAVSSMHYTGMSAITFYSSNDFLTHTQAHQMGNMAGLVIIVTGGMVLLLGILFLMSQIDRYVEYRTNFFDSATKLPNRRLFEQDLQKHLYLEHLSIWHLDGLEELNKTYSYHHVVEVMKRIGETFKDMAPESSRIYRTEENRIVFLLKDAKDTSIFKEAMQRIAEQLQKPFLIEGESIYLSSVFAVINAENRTEAVTLYANALAVIEHSSTNFVNEVVFYDPLIHTRTFEQEIVNDIGRAIKEGELFLVYQPKVSLNGNKVEGLETLLRWNHSTHGGLSPAVFIPLLEKHNRMVVVTDWIIEQVCKQIASWRDKGISFEQISINIPGDYVTSPKLLQVLQANMRHYQVSAAQLELEITETSFVKNIDKAIQAVIAFRKEGLSVALDDFGTGVSSLSYLKKMPISTLKIDKSFIDEIPASEKDSSIMEAMIGLGQSLKLTMVFEGVETKEQIEFLRNTCLEPVIQGYFYSKPQSSEEIVLWNQVHLATSKAMI